MFGSVEIRTVYVGAKQVTDPAFFCSSWLEPSVKSFVMDQNLFQLNMHTSVLGKSSNNIPVE